jgi:hypothetical protein
VISGFRREVDKICAVVGYYAAYSGDSLPTFRDILLCPFSIIKEFFTLEDGIDSLFRNVSKKLPLLGSALFT